MWEGEKRAFSVYIVKNQVFPVLLIFWVFLCQNSISDWKGGHSLTERDQPYRIVHDKKKKLSIASVEHS